MPVRVAELVDIEAMHRIRLAVRENVLSDPTKVQPKDYVDYLQQRGRGWVFEVDGVIAGFAIADASARSVWALFVSPAYEGRGIGRQLHDTMLKWLFDLNPEPVTLGTQPGTRAAGFYAAAGWQLIGSSSSGEAQYQLAHQQLRPSPK
ncbi:MAG: GNAT family N-acetyltransferase [Proteobacteria bacterium]|nr:GNAT family N-acetyltransferase [Pseudomonadota bacterium]